MTVPGTAGAIAEGLPDAARHDIYDAAGAPLYHRLTAGDRSELAEVLHVLRGLDGPVLELACGSGRLTLPLLAAGAEVTAIDLSPAMIELLGDTVAASPKLSRRAGRLTALVADMSAFALPCRFGAVVLATSSITLLDAAQRAACFARVRDHLAPGGRFLVSTIDVPDAGPVETVSPLPGDPPATLYVYLDPAAGRRWTSVVLSDEHGAPRAVFSSAPALLPSAALAAELALAGLELVRRHPVASGPSGHWLLECAVARSGA